MPCTANKPFTTYRPKAVGELLHRVRLPGQGEFQPDCGRFWAEACPKHGKIKKHKKSCGIWGCPKCYKIVAANDARDAVERLYQSMRLHNVHYRPAHFVFSFSDEEGAVRREWLPDGTAKGGICEVEPDTLHRLRLKLMTALNEYHSGPMGGVLIFHAYRMTSAGKRRYADYFKSARRRGVECMKKWDWLNHQFDAPEILFWSPHFHFEGCIYLPKSGDFHANTGIVYARIGKPHDVGAATRVISYQLQHHALMDDVRTVTWIGFASYNQTARRVDEKSKKWDVAHCEKCGEELVEVNTDFVDQREGHEGELLGPIEKMPTDVFRRVLHFSCTVEWCIPVRRRRGDPVVEPDQGDESVSPEIDCEKYVVV